MPAAPSSLPEPGRLPVFAIPAGFVLLAAAAFCFVAWNWSGVSAAVRLALPGGTVLLCLTFSCLAERGLHPRESSLALLAAALFIGLFWLAFGQTFQSGASVWDLCRVWAACIVPLFLLRRSAGLWNLLVMLLAAASCTEPPFGAWNGLHSAYLLPPLGVSAAACAAALTAARLRRVPCPNAWLALPLTLLLVISTALCAMLIFYGAADYSPSLPARLAGPAVLALILAAALITRHALALCALSLSTLALMNTALLRLLENPDPVGTPLAFLSANLAAVFVLPRVLSLILRRKERFVASARVPAALGGFFSALSLLALLFLCLGEEPSSLLAAGAVTSLGGTLLWRVRRGNAFLSVLASVLAAGGAVNVHLALLAFSPAVLLAAVWAATLTLYAIMDAPALRFSAVFWALVTSAATLPELLPAGFPLTLPLFFLLFLPLAAAACGRFPQGKARPAALACLGALLLLPALLSDPMAFFLARPFPLSLVPGSLEKAAMTAAPILSLAFLSRRLLAAWPAPRPHKGLECAAGLLALAALWLFCPLESLLFLNIAAAGLAGLFSHEGAPRSHGDTLFTGAGLTLLALCLTLAPFLLDLSYPEKMAALGLPGFCLLAAGLYGYSGRMEPRRLPAPAWRQALPFALSAALLTAAGTGSTLSRMTLLNTGREIMLPLSRLSLRTTLTGDALELRYELDGLALPLLDGPVCLPLDVDAQGIARPVPERLFTGKDCGNFKEVPALRLETASGTPRARLPRRYAVEEGKPPHSEGTAFARLRCAEDGTCLLTGLENREGQTLSEP
ncbi:DUF2157 domain-containing protein [uncultured Mailhella sp.]|uniref:DUF2157 domain-containing protein n=1 Tax=uncultured Mailhella sp. TaxID=1981031 RepID=UPI002602FDE7|nr:DUF2157 domain-containing protein [uncultured Mailhella sp.]